MDIIKALQVVGIFLQLLTGFLFLLERLQIDLDNSVKRKSEEMRNYIDNPKIATAIIFITLIFTVIMFFLVSAKLTGESLFDIEPPNLIIGILFAFFMAAGWYLLLLYASLWVADKTRINRILSKGTQSVKFIRRNLFLFVISLLISLVFLLIYNLTSQTSLIYTISALLIIAFASVVIISLLIMIIFLMLIGVAHYFGKPKRFWIILIIMWCIGGVSQLISALMVA